MTNLFFFDDANAKPPDEVVITELSAEPYPDDARVRVTIKITPFQQQPNLEIYARKEDRAIVAEMSVIETMTPLLEFTLHIRGVEELAGTYLLVAELYYEDRNKPQDRKEVTFEIGKTV
ncbi:MAG: hypothetical protein JW910_09795 [Anaerolineae bacterium]|nr:hypothetical protein [Anaerolineae bacterium]